MNLGTIINFCKLFKENRIIISKPQLNHVFQSYSFFHIQDNLSFDQEQKISQNLQKSSIILINEFSSKKKNNEEDQYFVISFNRTIVFIKQTSISFLSALFSKNSFQVYYLKNSKEAFDKYYHDEFNKELFKPNINYEIEFCNFNEYFIMKRTSDKVNYSLWKVVRDSITGYLIQQSYFKLNHAEVYNSELQEEITNQTYDKNEFIELRTIDKGSLFVAKLIYHIESERLFVCKYPCTISSETQKLIDRETSNYLELNCQYFPKFYGTIKDVNYPIIEYIDGKTLMYKDELNLSYNDKINIIFQIIVAIGYLNQHRFIYRDLKPNNIIIDKQKNPIIIDFDRMITLGDSNAKDQHTNDFSSEFIAPEVLNNKIKLKSDIYSIGQIIFFLFQLSDEQFNSKELYFNIKQIYSICTKIEYKERYNILELMCEYYSTFKTQIDISKFTNNPIIMLIHDLFKDNASFTDEIYNTLRVLFLKTEKTKIHRFIGYIYLYGEYVTRDINKAIYNFEIAANHNDSNAQLSLGCIYSEYEYGTPDFNKAIYYLTLSANQNNELAQHLLGFLYLGFNSIKPDFKKALYYLTLAANQNNADAQFSLGYIYYRNDFIAQDINKAIYYLSLAANQNHLGAQFNLGYIYHTCEYKTQDITKAIHYFSLAANQNDSNAQYIVGFYYYKGKYITKDITKAIYYFSLASKQNHISAQMILGDIYYKGKYALKDVNKAIYYFSLAANQNDSYAQFKLGRIYYEGKYIQQDINKAFNYFKISANQNNSYAQFQLGLMYYEGIYIPQDIDKAYHYLKISANQEYSEALFYLALLCYEYYKENINNVINYLERSSHKISHHHSQYFLALIYLIEPSLNEYKKKGINYLLLSAYDDNVGANFVLGYLYQEGKYFEKDIKKSIYHYKEASSFNHNCAKNNLGIIYKNEYINENNRYLGSAIEYFEESIRLEEDKVAMYNLATIYIFYIKDDESIDKSIDLLINSYNSGFKYSFNLLIIALFKRHGYNIDKIKQELIKRKNKIYSIDEFISLIIDRVNLNKLYDQSIFEDFYKIYQNIDYLYAFPPQVIISNSIKSDPNNSNKQNTYYSGITSNFYEGFEIFKNSDQNES